MFSAGEGMSSSAGDPGLYVGGTGSNKVCAKLPHNTVEEPNHNHGSIPTELWGEVFDGLDCESLWCLGVALRDYNGERLAIMSMTSPTLSKISNSCTTSAVGQNGEQLHRHRP